MKVFLILCAFIVGGFSLPLSDDQVFRWKLIPDTNGRLHMEDFKPVIADIEPTFDPLNDIQYLLFTRRNPTTAQRITLNMDTIRNSNYIVGNGVRFVIHGWQGSASTSMNTFITRDLLIRGDHNVIVVDWSAGADTTIYNNARQRVGSAGGGVARLIDSMHAAGLVAFEDVTIIGHNLGGHVAGFAGKQVTRGRVNAIFANDPSLDGFSAGQPTQRLHVTDAVYTETIHTDIGNQGFDQPITLVSMYPNWGTNQPGCGVVDWNGNCAHERSNLFYSESINSDRFVARQCSGFLQIQNRNCPGIGTGIMGGDVAKNLSGVFFLETNSNSPFARG